MPEVFVDQPLASPGSAKNAKKTIGSRLKSVDNIKIVLLYNIGKTNKKTLDKRIMSILEALLYMIEMWSKQDCPLLH